ncbi:adenosylcobinamide amidohydrolase [Microtetraspora sp. NBRC 16547]|uniref:adenosylcobinamide amidohydrolase n=1 Tax=Microtetraspora sp. NBRC 16547 TaxID=3030993 RepID=UPI0024A09028|nr:adenosylcobinamide amidohydrolase [Microtetraspora sp. NBRC 16547]GLW97053.1 adenosylcobinamide amidohydrolase [Microtetraspora sp. NBRC 16547]
MRMTLGYRDEDGARLASLLWEFGPGWRMISSAMLGGGIGPREWVLNAQVIGAYARMDPLDHLAELAPEGAGAGVGMLTAASVDRYVQASDGGVEAVATVGLRVPTWAASPEGRTDPELRPALVDPAPLDPAQLDPASLDPAQLDSAQLDSAPLDSAPSGFPAPGTINIIVAVPVPFTDAALVNAVMTVTEAKTQALIEAGFQCTGTASDAVCVAVRDGGVGGGQGDGPGDGTGELFGGPRSIWGARIARAVHQAVLAGARHWTATHLG